MNKFYYFENNIYKTRKEAEAAAKNYNNKKITEILTVNNFKNFEKLYTQSRDQGNSIIDSIEWAKTDIKIIKHYLSEEN